MHPLILFVLLALSFPLNAAPGRLNYLQKTIDASGQADLNIDSLVMATKPDGTKQMLTLPSLSVSAYIAGNQYESIKLGMETTLAAYDSVSGKSIRYRHYSPFIGIESRRITFWYPQFQLFTLRGSGKLNGYKVVDRSWKAELRNVFPVSRDYAFNLAFGLLSGSRSFFEKIQDTSRYRVPTKLKNQSRYVTFGLTAWVN